MSTAYPDACTRSAMMQQASGSNLSCQSDCGLLQLLEQCDAAFAVFKGSVIPAAAGVEPDS